MPCLSPPRATFATYPNAMLPTRAPRRLNHRPSIFRFVARGMAGATVGLLLLSILSPVRGQSLTGEAQVNLTVEVPADELWASLRQQQAQLDRAREERRVLRLAVDRLLAEASPPAPAAAQPPPPVPERPTPPASINGFTPLVKSRDTRVVYVAADGNDRNHGRTPDAPMRTPRKAYARLGDGRADWLLFKAGDVFEDALGELTKSGRSAEEPFVLGVYGPPEDGRPIFHVRDAHWIHSSFRNDLKHVVIQGLEAVAIDRDPTREGFDPDSLGELWKQGGINLLGDDADILIEDCVLRYFSVALVFQSGNGHAPMQSIRLNRNIVVDSYNHWDSKVGGHSQGLYAQEVDGLLIEANVFDHNGWSPQVDGAVRTKFNHNLYVQTDCRNVAVRDNLITRGASHGLQLRPGGEITDNYFSRNALAFFAGWHHSTVVGNIVTSSDDISPQEPRGLGIEIMPCYEAVVAHNIFARKRGTAEHAKAIDIKWDRWYIDYLAGNEFNVKLYDNKVYDWPAYAGREPTIRIDAAARMRVNENNPVDDPAWIEPRRDAGPYMGTLGQDPTFEAFMDAARSRPRGQWDPAFSAADLLDYIRGGFVTD